MAELIGAIVALQVQRTGLIENNHYDPKPLLAVDELAVAANGVLGASDGGWVLDVHSAAHPDGTGRRPLSIGFTSHYDHMRTRFGELALGAAGENIVVETDRMFTEPELAGGLTVRGADHPDVTLASPKVARPCRQFSNFLLGSSDDPDKTNEARKFLDEGVRGYICGIQHVEGYARIRVGDEVWLESE